MGWLYSCILKVTIGFYESTLSNGKTLDCEAIGYNELEASLLYGRSAGQTSTRFTAI